MEEVFNQLISVGTGLCILVGAWFIWLISGIANNLFSENKWSWKRMFEDIVKTIVMAIAILSWVLLINAIDWYTANLGLDVSALLDGANVVGLIAIIIGGSANYAFKAFKNFARFIGESHVAKVTGEQDYGKLASDVKEFVETITNMTSKEDIETSVATSDAPELQYVEIPEKEAGRGGVNNTYPEPYRSRLQDSMTDPSTCYNRECVSYTAWKIKELTGKWPTRTGGMNAKYWVQRLAENGYTKVVAKPQNGGKYVGVSEAGQYGHVVWFEEGETISEYNYSIRGGFSVRIVNPAAYKWVQIKAPAPAPAPTPTKKEEPKKEEAKPAAKPAKKDNTISYTYQPGDDFGNVIVKLGLKTSHGLWDPVDGDVAYYNKQLAAQGITGNIPIGTTIKLTPRE